MIMGTTMIIRSRDQYGKLHATQHQCLTGYCAAKLKPTDTFKQYFSEDHAVSEGWLVVKGPSKVLPETGWVCPTCVKHFKEEGILS